MSGRVNVRYHVGGVMGTTWDTAELMGAERSAAKVSEAGDEGVTKSWAV
jgi:hypothetical protein